MFYISNLTLSFLTLSDVNSNSMCSFMCSGNALKSWQNFELLVSFLSCTGLRGHVQKRRGDAAQRRQYIRFRHQR